MQRDRGRLWRGVAALLILGGCAHSDPWTNRDTNLQIAASVAMLADAYTTAQIHRTPGVYEGGALSRRIIGRTPSSSDTYTYFAVIIVGSYLVSTMLPAKWRPYWQGWETGIHLAAAIRNCDHGLCESPPLPPATRPIPIPPIIQILETN